MALDACEPAIIRALEKDGWTIREKPFTLQLIPSKRTVYADLGLQRVYAGRIEEIIVLEVKCFIDPIHDLQELYTAIGQCIVYRAAMLTNGIDLPLYLVIPTDAYERLMFIPAFEAALKLADIKIVVVDIVMEVIASWIS